MNWQLPTSGALNAGVGPIAKRATRQRPGKQTIHVRRRRRRIERPIGRVSTEAKLQTMPSAGIVHE